MLGVGSVWIHFLLMLHIYTLLVTDKVTDFFQDPCLSLSVNWLLSRPLFVEGVGGGRR